MSTTKPDPITVPLSAYLTLDQELKDALVQREQLRGELRAVINERDDLRRRGVTNQDRIAYALGGALATLALFFVFSWIFQPNPSRAQLSAQLASCRGQNFTLSNDNARMVGEISGLKTANTALQQSLDSANESRDNLATQLTNNNDLVDKLWFEIRASANFNRQQLMRDQATDAAFDIRLLTQLDTESRRQNEGQNDFIRYTLEMAKLVAVANINASAANAPSPNQNIGFARWLGSFDAGAWDDLKVNQIEILQVPNNGLPGIMTFTTTSGGLEFVYWNNRNAVFNSDSTPLTPGKYMISDRFFTPNGDGNTETNSGNLGQLMLDRLP